MVDIRAEAHAAAPLATAWSVLADQSGMAAWTPARTVMIEHQGDPRPAGVGTIRVLSLVLLKIREQITAVDEPNRLTYRLLSGIRVRDYVGETILTGTDTATEMLWKVTRRRCGLGAGTHLEACMSRGSVDAWRAAERWSVIRAGANDGPAFASTAVPWRRGGVPRDR
jgi:uncharacterized protein YndB with AHSA1/START domain